MLSNEVRIVNGRIVPTNIFFKDANTKDRSKTEILADIQDVKEDIAECKKEGRFYGDIQEELKDLEKELSEVTDSKTKDEDKQVEAYGIKGTNSTPWRKIFKNQAEFEKWLEVNKGDVEVQGTRVVDSATQDEYSDQRKALEAKLKQAQEDGDTQKAKEIQEEINELIKSGTKDYQSGQSISNAEYQRMANEITQQMEDIEKKGLKGNKDYKMLELKLNKLDEDYNNYGLDSKSKDCQSKDIGFGGKGYKCRNCGATDSIAGKIKHVKDDNSPWIEGMEASMNGKPITDNPYPKESEEYEKYNKGWRENQRKS